jgi:hypothetical protein
MNDDLMIRCRLTEIVIVVVILNVKIPSVTAVNSHPLIPEILDARIASNTISLS